VLIGVFVIITLATTAWLRTLQPGAPLPARTPIGTEQGEG
jgi:hypothetical protein